MPRQEAAKTIVNSRCAKLLTVLPDLCSPGLFECGPIQRLVQRNPTGRGRRNARLLVFGPLSFTQIICRRSGTAPELPHLLECLRTAPASHCQILPLETNPTAKGRAFVGGFCF